MKACSGLRWEIGIAAKEFGVHRQTLSARMKRAGILAGKDDCYSTAEIDKAVNGDIESERLRELRERADKLALENAQTRGELIPIHELLPVLHRAVIAIKAEISSITYIEREDKDKILLKCGELTELVFADRSQPEGDVQATAAA